MTVKAIDFKKKAPLDKWLEKNGDNVRIINVATTKRWGVFCWGF